MAMEFSGTLDAIWASGIKATEKRRVAGKLAATRAQLGPVASPGDGDDDDDAGREILRTKEEVMRRANAAIAPGARHGIGESGPCVSVGCVTRHST